MKHWSAPDESRQCSVLTDSNPSGIIQRFYYDVLAKEAMYHASMLRKQALGSLTASAGVYVGRKDVPSWYLLTTDDQAMSPVRQRQMVQLAKEQGAGVMVREIQTGRSPFLSRVDEVLGFVEEAMADFFGDGECR